MATKKPTVVSTQTISCRGPHNDLDCLAVALKVFTDGSQEVIDCPYLRVMNECNRDYRDTPHGSEFAHAGERIYGKCRYNTRRR